MPDHRKRGEADVLIIGASTRAAAFSALRANLNPTCADLFADQDLTARCTVTRLPGSEFPDGFERVARTAPSCPWVYVGALENHPDLVARISAEHILWGNGAEVLRRVRDPFQVAECLVRAGLPCPAVQSLSDSVSTEVHWLVKPIAGAGGRGIRTYIRRDCPHEKLKDRFYLQERISGLPCAALFVGDGCTALFLGLTQQLVGDAAVGARPFHYCGSIGPLPLDDHTHTAICRLGCVLAAEFGLTGIFGVDGVLNKGAFWPVEVNPRYTASAEVLELALRIPLMSLHRDACVSRRGAYIPAVSDRAQINAPALLATPASGRREPRAFPASAENRWPYAPRSPTYLAQPPNLDSTRIRVGKAILFAPGDVKMPDLSAALGDHHYARDRWSVPPIADVPAQGEQILMGHPICTVFAKHTNVAGCRDALRQAAAEVYDRFRSSVGVGQ